MNKKEPSIHFYIKTAQKDEEQPVVLFTRINKVRVIYYTQFKCHPMYWGKDRAKSSKEFSRSVTADLNRLNKELAHIEELAKKIIIAEPKIDPTSFKLKLNVLLGRKELPVVEPVVEQIKETVVELKTTLGESSKRSYTAQLKLVREFCKERGVIFSLEAIDNKFLIDFEAYAVERLRTVYVSKVVKTLRAVAKRQGIVNKDLDAFRIDNLRAGTEDVKTNVFLTNEEIARIEQLGKTNEKVRDLFLFAVHTGCRVSDLMRFKPSDFKQKGEVSYLEYLSQKTKKRCAVPLSKRAIEIAKKYEYTLPVIAHQYGNKEIKKMCKAAGINELVTYIDEQAGRLKEVTKEKSELVTWHTARRTFITRAKDKGVSMEALKSMVGHSSDLMNMHYDSQKTAEKALREADKFN